jgi:excisionase family DNA binding protein
MESEQVRRAELESLLDVEGAADVLGISRASLYRLMAEGKVEVVKLRSRTLFRPADLADLVERARRPAGVR